MTSSTTSATAEQLTLLPEPTVPLRFRLDDATRRRGLRHIAEIRAQLERSARPITAVTNITAITTVATGPAIPMAPMAPTDVERPAA